MSASSVSQSARRLLRSLLVVIVAALLALMTVQIVLRYGFNASLLWAEEASRYLLIWLSFLALVLAYERGEVAALGFLGSLLPRVPALVLAAFASLASAFLCILLVYYGWLYAQWAGREPIPALRFIFEDIFGPSAPSVPTSFWVYVALPVGMAVLALRLVTDALLYLQAIPAGSTVFGAIERHPENIVE